MKPPAIFRLVLAIALAIVMLPGMVAAQTNHQVIFPGEYDPYGLHHTLPSHINIKAGDSIWFSDDEATGSGGVEHNLTSDNGEFPPSETSADFRYYLVFNKAGTFPYHCTVHDQAGSVTVTIQDPAIEINAGMDDAWNNPETYGQGFFITVFPDVHKVFLSWFTYDLERPEAGTTAQLGEPGHRWLTAFGTYSGNTATLDIEQTRGGIFNASFPAPTQFLDGTVVLQFSNCNAGEVRYDIPSLSLSGTIPIERTHPSIYNISLCEELQPH